MFNVVIEQFAALQKSNLEQIAKASQLAFAQAERSFAWNLGVAKQSSEELLADVKTVASVKDAQGVASLNRLAEGKAEKVADYSRAVYDQMTRSQAETAKFVEGAAAEMNSAFVKFVDQVAKSAPVGGEAFAQQFKQAVAAQQAAAQQATNTFKQATSAAQNAAQSAVGNVVATVAKKGRK
jgi:phasin family protein